MTEDVDDLIQRFLNPCEEDIGFVLTFVMEEMLLEDYDVAVASLRRLQQEFLDTPSVH